MDMKLNGLMQHQHHLLLQQQQQQQQNHVQQQQQQNHVQQQQQQQQQQQNHVQQQQQQNHQNHVQQQEAQQNPLPTQIPNQNHQPLQSDAPPKQVALAMERLSQAARLIADVRIGADRLLEALFIAAHPHQSQSSKPIQLFIKEDSSMRNHLQQLRSLGRQLEESGVLNESLRLRGNSWGLHMPLVCPDGAVVAYAWKRQLAGQAGASAVDRTRLALKAFTDQKRKFFPHLDDDVHDVGLMDSASGSTEPVPKKRRDMPLPVNHLEEGVSDCKTLSEVLSRLEKEMPDVKIFTYERVGWLKRASLLPNSANENPLEMPKETHGFHILNKLRTVSQGPVDSNKVAVIELLFPSVFRAVVSLHPVGSIDPDAVAFFSPDEGGSYMHARGVSVHHVFRRITEHAGMALQHFLGSRTETALYSLLHWTSSYQTIFTKGCSKCGRLLAMDQVSSSFLPPVQRVYRNFSPTKNSTTQTITTSTKDQNLEVPGAFHIGCFSEDL